MCVIITILTAFTCRAPKKEDEQPMQTSDSKKRILIKQQLGAEWEEALKQCGRRTQDIGMVIREFASVAVQAFAEFAGEIHSATFKSSLLPEDATVHEMTSNTLTFLKRLTEYLDIVEIVCHLSRNGSEWSASLQMEDKEDIISKLSSLRDQSKKILQVLHQGGADVSLSPSSGQQPSPAAAEVEVDLFQMTSSRQFFADTLQSLIASLEVKAKSYKKNLLERATSSSAPTTTAASTADLNNPKSIHATIFLLNNYHYIIKTMRANRLACLIVGKQFELELNGKFTAELKLYQQFYQPIVALLMVITIL